MPAPYTDEYASIYRRLYIDDPQWAAKHRFNIETVRALLPAGGSWLDLFCGQAWHFAQIDSDGPRVGVDLSAAQLAVAARDNPGAELVEADLRTWDTDRRFDLVTSFWSGISYLDDLDAIGDLVDRAVGWVRPGGHLYIEVVTPENLADFNGIPFAIRESCEVGARPDASGGDGDWIRWSYRDPGGEHRLTSPDYEHYRRRLVDHFESVSGDRVITTLRQIIARSRTVALDPTSPG